MYHSCITYIHMHIFKNTFVHLSLNLWVLLKKQKCVLRIISESCLHQLSTYHRCSIFFVTQKVNKNWHDIIYKVKPIILVLQFIWANYIYEPWEIFVLHFNELACTNASVKNIYSLTSSNLSSTAKSSLNTAFAFFLWGLSISSRCR